jgi:hypothetical protein
LQATSLLVVHSDEVSVIGLAIAAGAPLKEKGGSLGPSPEGRSVMHWCRGRRTRCHPIVLKRFDSVAALEAIEERAPLQGAS